MQRQTFINNTKTRGYDIIRTPNGNAITTKDTTNHRSNPDSIHAGTSPAMARKKVTMAKRITILDGEPYAEWIDRSSIPQYLFRTYCNQ